MPQNPPEFGVSSEINRSWPRYNRRGVINLPANPLLDAGAVVFTMGSCFALEIRRWLTELGCQVVPAYEALDVDLDNVRIGQLPKRLNLNHYHTFAIRQEIERCLGLWEQAPDDHWEVRPDCWFGNEVAYQDPYRRGIFARTPDDLHKAIAGVDDAVRAGLEAADLFLITLGLTEVWRKKDDGRFACMSPGFARGGGHAEAEFHLSTLAENIENLSRTVELIGEARPSARVVLTVSPVPLAKTFTSQDVFVANMESKCTLRAAAAEVSRAFEHVEYFPAYEVCAAIGDVYEADGRHVRPEIVERIVTLFLEQHHREPAALTLEAAN